MIESTDNDTSMMKNKVRSDAVVTCIGSRVQENVLYFGQNKTNRHILGIFLDPLSPYWHKTA